LPDCVFVGDRTGDGDGVGDSRFFARADATGRGYLISEGRSVPEIRKDVKTVFCLTSFDPKDLCQATWRHPELAPIFAVWA
jgi:hypothetical protein